MDITRALALARERGVARLDAQLLLAHQLGRPREWLLAHDGEMLSDAVMAAYDAALAQRAAGVPCAYLLGEREFHGLRLQVTRDVLVPRPETELLVDWALALLATAPAPHAIDLGTGSGAIALALANAAPQAIVTATEASPAALAVARANARQLGLTGIEFVAGDWWAPLAGRRWGLALANPPYIAGDDPHLADLGHEPRQALTPEGDGLAALRRIVDGAPDHLLPGAWLLLEHGHDQADAVQGLLAARGFAMTQTRRDLAGLPRCTGALWTGARI